MNVAWLFVCIIEGMALAGFLVSPTQALLVFLFVYALGGTGIAK